MALHDIAAQAQSHGADQKAHLINIAHNLAHLLDVIFPLAKRGDVFPYRDIVGKDGKVYMTRHLLVGHHKGFDDGFAKLFGKTVSGLRATVPDVSSPGLLYLHQIHKPDADPALHTHPWDGVSLILRGGYEERFCHCTEAYNPDGTSAGYTDGKPYLVTERSAQHLAGDIVQIDAVHAHKIVDVAPNTWTLARTSGRVSRWGFLRRKETLGLGSYSAEYVDFKRYFQEEGYPSL